MRSNLRHVGIMAKDLKESIRFYNQFGFWKIKQRPGKEIWLAEPLEIIKLINDQHQQIELIQGNWKPHVALTLTEGTMDDVWERFAVRADVILQVKKEKDQAVVYMKDPAGNFVEVVCPSK